MLVLNRTPRSFDSRMMAMAARLFAEYDRLPVSVVLDAIAQARRECRGHCDLSELPERVEHLARQRLTPPPGRRPAAPNLPRPSS